MLREKLRLVRTVRDNVELMISGSISRLFIVEKKERKPKGIDLELGQPRSY